jgi:hypothetical protein
MFWRVEATQSWVTRALPRVLIAAVLVVGLAMSTVLTTEAAQACATDSKLSNSVSIVQKSERALAVVSAASAPTVVLYVSQDHRRCCDGIHPQGADCASACCFAVSAVTNGAIVGLVFAASIRHSLPRQGGLNATRLPPDFRPPRTFA